MKKVIITIISILLISFSGICANASEVTEGSAEQSYESGDSGYINTEEEAKKTVWIYFLIGGITTAAAITAVVVITKKFK